MENKEQLNQNPEDNNVQPQEANSNSELNKEETSSQKVKLVKDKDPEQIVEPEIAEVTDNPTESTQKVKAVVEETNDSEPSPKPRKDKKDGGKNEVVSADIPGKPMVPETETEVSEVDAITDQGIDDKSHIETPEEEDKKEPEVEEIDNTESDNIRVKRSQRRNRRSYG
ncbi:MAG: hypothetical protein R2764_04540 [Bacteroidales bacterium]